MVCFAWLFLVPIVNLFPVIFDIIMAKLYRLFGWEYRKPARAPPASPIGPSPSETVTNYSATGDLGTKAAPPNQDTPAPYPATRSVGDDDGKLD